MEQNSLNWIANFIWGIADDVLRDLYVRGKYRDVIEIPYRWRDWAADEDHGRTGEELLDFVNTTSSLICAD